MASETRTSVESAENGWIVTVNSEESDAEGRIQFTSKRYIAASAKEAQAIMTKVMK